MQEGLTPDESDRAVDVPSAADQIAQHGLIEHAPLPSGESNQSGNVPEAGPGGVDTMHGGYTGVQVGQMGEQIDKYRAAGLHGPADALQVQLDVVAPPSTPPDSPEAP